MLYTAAIDDSADRDRQRVVVSGAIIGDASRWNALIKLWSPRLAQDGIAYFKSSHCKHLRNQFHKFRDLENYPPPLGRQIADKLQHDLDAIIHRCKLVCIGAVVPMDVYNRMKDDPDYGDMVGNDPYHWAVQAVWGECAWAMIKMGRNNVVTFVHDNSDNFHFLSDLYREFKKKNKRFAKVMGNLAPMDDKIQTPIQAADVTASVIFRYAEDWALNPTNENLKRLRQNMYKIVYWNEQAARHVVSLEKTGYQPRSG